MLTRPLPAVIPLCLLLVGGCFDPDSPADADASSGTSGTASDSGDTDPFASSGNPGPMTGGQTDDGPNPTDGGSETAEPVDEPPVINSFTVNGQTSVPEQERAGRVVLLAEVADDQGIDRVEFFDDGTLLATDDEAPYQYETVLASEHNGTHTFHAVVFDSTEQSAQSDVVALSINIDGGELLILREDIGDVSVESQGIFPSGFPGISGAPTGDIVVTGTARSGTPADFELGLLSRHFNARLSLVGANEYYPTAPGVLEFDLFSPSTTTPDGTQTTLGGVRVLSSSRTSTTFVLNHTTRTLETTDVWPEFQTGRGTAVFAVADDGQLFVQTDRRTIARLSTDGQDIIWEHHLDTPGSFTEILGIAATPSGGVVVSYVSSDDCVGDCIRQIASDGTASWTQTGGSAPYGPLRPPVVGPDGTVLLNSNQFDATLLRYSAIGEELPPIDPPPSLAEARYQAAGFSPTGSLVIVASSFTGGTVANLTAEGEEIWSAPIDVGANTTIPSGVTLSEDGQLYVVGVSDLEDGLIGNGFWAQAWLAEFAL